jgi:hypothetical protein
MITHQPLALREKTEQMAKSNNPIPLTAAAHLRPARAPRSGTSIDIRRSVVEVNGAPGQPRPAPLLAGR